ncbi:hypothetical protein [Streptomyces sp. NPDC088752]|uniref:hypothetical protein n=1 Tax=Streptomyces sp. NPDC088752 TaxID=3154963 RepID=UPI0034330DC8
MTLVRIDHPYLADLGRAIQSRRQDLALPQRRVAGYVGLSVRDLAALESGFIPPQIAENISKISLDKFDTILDWDPGTASLLVKDALISVTNPNGFTIAKASTGLDRSTYPRSAWIRLGKAALAARLALKMTRPVLAYAVQSSSKTMLRFEEGRVYGDPRTAPPGDYNSEKYWLKRLSLLEMALEWEEGQARQILDGAAS